MTFAEAEAIIDEDGHGESEENPDGMARVYVSPEPDGWTLVIGPWCDPCDAERSDDVLRLCRDLSVRYGQAQAYYYGSQGDGSAWLVAQDGVVLRRYSETGEADDAYLTLGEPLPLERAQISSTPQRLPTKIAAIAHAAPCPGLGADPVSGAIRGGPGPRPAAAEGVGGVSRTLRDEKKGGSQ
ncbi:hypothetical protein ABZT08_25190 [Streptomyces sp. NPDC005526]|uniref:hypothetical protein n=1 Tax=Streptomyces sp. NPDC005526 TaxID=3156885 RepID=UPI0033BCC93A